MYKKLSDSQEASLKLDREYREALRAFRCVRSAWFDGIMRISSLNVFFILVYIVGIALRISAVPEICTYGNRQLIVGQTYIDCYVKVTCYPKGETEISKSCRSYFCERPNMWRGYKRFDSSKSYPDCCGGSICADGRIIYYNTLIRSYRDQRDPSNDRLT